VHRASQQVPPLPPPPHHPTGTPRSPRCRCYRYTVKCNETSEFSVKLTGHVVLVQQTAPDELVDGLQPALDAAASGISIVFAGSPALLNRSHCAGRLATILELRKHVILRWLQVLDAINPEFSCPRLMADLSSADSDAVLAALPTQIIEAAVHADGEMMQAIDALCDDVARVRALEDDDAIASADLAEFDRVVLVPRYNDTSAEQAARQEQRAIESAVIKMDASASLEDEFGDQRTMLSRAFPWILCLGAVMAIPRSTGPLSTQACRHLLLQHTCAAAHDHDLVFLLADQKRRHASCRGASAAVATGHVQAFKELIEDAQFKAYLVRARDGSQRAAKEVGRLCRPHLAIAGAQIPNGPVTRAKAVSRIHAMCYELGLPSIYLTVSPDTAHTSAAVRMSVPEGGAPFNLQAFEAAFEQGSTFHCPGWTAMNLSSPSLRTLCSQNPVAAAETFHNRLQAVLAELLKCEEESTQKKTPPRWRLVGIFGTAYGFYCVVEAQGRGALHYHLLFWGTYAPHILSQAAAREEFRTRLEEALKTQTVGELPRALHMQRLRARGLRAKSMANGDSPPPRMSRVPMVSMDEASILKRAQECASASCIHGHSATCHKGAAGECWCRMCKPEGYQETDCAAFMHVTVDEGAGVRASRIVPEPDISCTPMRNVQTHPIECIDHRLVIVEHPRRRDDRPLEEHEIAGLPPDTVQWMREVLPLQNGLVSNFNVPLMACEPSNQACVQLSCTCSAKGTCYYCRYVPAAQCFMPSLLTHTVAASTSPRTATNSWRPPVC
jgi:hypothetical protein